MRNKEEIIKEIETISEELQEATKDVLKYVKTVIPRKPVGFTRIGEFNKTVDNAQDLERKLDKLFKELRGALWR